jgi:hypothetical protein
MLGLVTYEEGFKSFFVTTYPYHANLMGRIYAVKRTAQI